MRCCLRLVLAHDSHARQVTTAADGGFNDAWIMRFGQSAEDGAMPLIHCCVAPDVQDRDFFEPPGAKGRLLRERVVEREEERAGGGGGGEGGDLGHVSAGRRAGPGLGGRRWYPAPVHTRPTDRRVPPRGARRYAQATKHMAFNSGLFYLRANDRTYELMGRIAGRLAREHAWDQVRGAWVTLTEEVSAGRRSRVWGVPRGGARESARL